MYFDQLLGAARTQKLVKTFFSAVFQPFFHFKAFSVVSRLKLTKKVWKWTRKMWFCLLLKAGQHAKAGRLPEGVPRNCLFRLIICQIARICEVCDQDGDRVSKNHKSCLRVSSSQAKWNKIRHVNFVNQVFFILTRCWTWQPCKA